MGLLDNYGPLLQGVKKKMPSGTNPGTGLADLYSPKSMPPGTNPFGTPLQPKMDFGYGEPGFPSSKAGMPAIPLDDAPSTKIGAPMRPDENYGSLPPLGPEPPNTPSTVAGADLLRQGMSPASRIGNAMRGSQPNMNFGLGDKGFGGAPDIRDALRPSPGPPHWGITPEQRRGAAGAFTDMDFGVGDVGFGGDPAKALGMIKPPVRPPGLGSGPGTDMADASLGVLRPPVRPPGLGTGLLANAPMPPVRPPGLGINAGGATIAKAPIAPIAPSAQIAAPIASAPSIGGAMASMGGGIKAGGAGGGGLGGLAGAIGGIAKGLSGGSAPPPPDLKPSPIQPMQPDPREAQRKQGAAQLIESGLLGGGGLLDDPRKRRGLA